MADDTTAPALPALQLTLLINPPVEAHGRTWDSITLREPTAADMASADPFEGFRWRVELVTRVSELPGDVIRAVGISLLNTCTDYLGAWINARAELPHVALGGTITNLQH